MAFPVYCTACGFELPSVDAGPCPKCGSTAKTVSMSAAGYSQSSGRAALETVIVSTIADLRNAITEQKREIIWPLPKWSLPAISYHIIYAMLALAILALALGYNVESCPKIKVDGVEFSFCIKLTKPPPQH